MGYLTEEGKHFSVKFCEQCKMSYEIVNKDTKGRILVERYSNFPTLGLERKDCPDCRIDIDDLIGEEDYSSEVYEPSK